MFYHKCFNVGGTPDRLRPEEHFQHSRTGVGLPEGQGGVLESTSTGSSGRSVQADKK